MSAADKRVGDLLDRWLRSVELHARYLALDDDAYARVQDWPRHQRPTRWIVELARTRVLELKRLHAARSSAGDGDFAAALELMGFLTNLLGSEHVERFIPLAEEPERKAGAAVPPAPSPPAAVPAAPRPARAAVSRPAPKVATAPGRAASATPAPTTTAAPPAAPAKPAIETPVPEWALKTSEKMTATVIADAVRLLSWGREWPQLAGLIARLADRPPEKEIWQILRHYRTDIERQVKRSPD